MDTDGCVRDAPYYFYKDLLGAEESFPTDAYWNETIPPQNEDTTP